MFASAHTSIAYVFDEDVVMLSCIPSIWPAVSNFRVTYRQLEIFLAIVDEGGFAAAADRLNISQAAISRQMLALERRLGWELFERHPGKSSSLSERGRLLLSQAPELIEKVSEAASVWNSPLPRQENVRVATGELIQNKIFLPKMAEFHHNHPDIQVEFVEMPPSLSSVALMSKEKIDLAYFTMRDDGHFIPGEPLATVEHGLFINPNHPIAGSWHAGSAVSLPLIMFLSGSFSERSISTMLESEGITNYHVVARSQRSDMIAKLAIEGVGACFMVRHLVEDDLCANRLIELDFKPSMALRRYKFRRNTIRPLSHVDVVEGFLTPLVVNASRTEHPVSASPL